MLNLPISLKDVQMTRNDIETKILDLFKADFDIEDPGMDEDLGEVYEFDSIDAIDMLVVIEQYLDTTLTVEEKREAINIRNINNICDYVEGLAKTRNMFD
jgi:acyl carrier protein